MHEWSCQHITENMLQLLLRRYDNYTQVVNIAPIVSDFEMIESS